MKLTATMGESLYFLAVIIDTSWSGRGENSRWNLKTAVNLPSGERTLIARQGDWELWATADMELRNGATLSQMRSVEADGIARPWPFTYRDQRTVRESFDAGRQICWYPQEALYFSCETPESPLVELPSEFNRAAHGMFEVVKKTAEPHPIDLSAPGIFAGYDPLANLLVVVAPPAILDQLDELIELPELDPGNISLETNAAAGNWYLLGRSGEAVSLVKQNSGNEDRAFKIEPTLAGNQVVMDAKYLLDAVSGGLSWARVESSSTLRRDQTLKIGAYQGSDGEEIPIELTFHYQDIHR